MSIPSEQDPSGFNPYAAPQTGFESLDLVQTDAQDEHALRIRLEHSRAESEIKSISLLDFLAGGWTIVAGLVIFLGGGLRVVGAVRADEMTASVMLGTGLGTLAVGGLLIALGVGLRRLANWARWPHVIIASLGILSALPGLVLNALSFRLGAEAIGSLFGLFFNGYVLSLLLSPKAKLIFSPRYQEIIRQTPQIQTRMSLVVKIAVGLLMLLLVAAMIGGLFILLGGLRR